MNMFLSTVTPRWALRWLELALMVLISSVLLCTPFIPLVWLLWNWVMPLLGLPRLTFLEAGALLFLLRFLQVSVVLGHPSNEKT